MAKWYEAANEASFKAVAGGYVFQSPNPWIFARPRYYLVSEAQKSEISARLRRWRLLLLTLLAVTFPVIGSIVAFATASPATFVRLFLPVIQLGSGFFLLLMILMMTLIVAPLVVAPHIYLIRALRLVCRPLLI